MNQYSATAGAAYRKAAIAVPPLTAIVRLYDRVIVLMQRAALAAESKQPQESFTNVTEATTILRGLSYALDFQHGGQIAERLRNMYTGTILALMSSYGRPDTPARYRRLAAGFIELRDAWVEVARHPQNTGAARSARAG
jgi:flagellar protein FliS